MPWTPKSLRLTLFAPSERSAAPKADFEHIVGVPYANMQTHAKGVIQWDARVDPCRVLLVRQEAAQRLDLVVMVDPESSAEAPTLNAFPSAADADRVFRPLARRATEADDLYRRVAIGVEYIILGPTRERAYESLRAALPRQDFEGATDVRYQINRPRPSKSVDGLLVNRLATWAVLQRSVRSIDLSEKQVITEGDPEYMAHLATDINTPSSFGRPFPAAECASLVNELLDLSHEIATKGDVR